MVKPPIHTVDRDRLTNALKIARDEILRQTGPLYGKGGIAVLGKETIRLIDDLAMLVTGKRDFFRAPEVGLTGPSTWKAPPKEPE